MKFCTKSFDLTDVQKTSLRFKIARSLPDWLIFYCAIVVGAHATTGKYGDTVVPELTFLDAIKRWEK